jgi:hypothetical protein
VTRDDAQLLFDWLCRHYGYPGESPAPCKELAHGDNNHQRETNPKHTDNVRVVELYPQKIARAANKVAGGRYGCGARQRSANAAVR